MLVLVGHALKDLELPSLKTDQGDIFSPEFLWLNFFKLFCRDKRVSQKLKGKFYRTAIRPAMLYGAECWPTKRRHAQQISVAEMRMLRWICGHTRSDRVRNDDIRDRLGVAPIEEKLVQQQLRWFGHVQRRPPEAPVRSGILSHDSNVKRGRGRPKLIWVEAIKGDLKWWNIPKDLALYRSEKQLFTCLNLVASAGFEL